MFDGMPLWLTIMLVLWLLAAILQLAAALIRSRTNTSNREFASNLADAGRSVTVFTHEEAKRKNPNLPSQVHSLFDEAGWKVSGASTNLPQHAKGIWIHGGSVADRTIARWAMRTLNIPAQIDTTLEDVPLQVIVGAVSPTPCEESFKERLTAAEANIAKLAKERDWLEYSLSKCKRSSAIATIRSLVKRTIADKWDPPVHVTIRFANYADFDLVQKIEATMKEYASDWPLVVDGSNAPVIRPSDEFKVIFESGINQAFDGIAAAFVDGALLGDYRLGRRSADRNDNHLVVEVLPTVKSGG